MGSGQLLLDIHTFIGNNTPTEEKCEEGEHRNNNMLCSNCIPGKYQDEKNLTGCKLCSTGSSTKLYKQSSCEICIQGEYQNDIGQTVCKRCIAGRYGVIKNATNVTQCSICDEGKWSFAGLTKCYPCPSGRSSNQTGLTSGDACAPVPIGKYASAQGIAIDCPSGKYQDVNGSTYCKLCKSGRYNNQIGQTSCNHLCNAGKYSLEGASYCIECSLGTNSQVGASKCEFDICPSGYYQSFIEGKPCSPCPQGRFNSLRGGTSINDCKYCSKGEIITIYIYLNIFNLIIVKGEFSPGGQPYCFKCSSGMISENIGASECKQCKYPTVSNEERSMCVCPVNYYRNFEGLCVIPCPLGVDCESSGNEINKLKTKSGWWRLAQNSTKVYSCPGGNATCIGGTNTTTQCNDGSHGVLCALCKLKYQRDIGSKKCVPCPKTTWVVYIQFLGLLMLGILFLHFIIKSNRSKGDGFIRPFIQMWQDLSIYMMVNFILLRILFYILNLIFKCISLVSS